MKLDAEQTAFIVKVQELWSQGLTQEQVADRMGRSLSTVRNRLAYYGYKFGRLGKLERIEAEKLPKGRKQKG